MRKVVSITVVCFMIIAVFSGCAILQKLGLQESDNDELHPVSSIAMTEDEAKKLTDKVPIHLYFSNEDNSKLKLEVRYISMKDAKKSVSNLANIIVAELINGPSKDSGLKATLPKGAKIGSKVKVDLEAATATVDLNKDFVAKHPGGKDAERITIYSIVNSLTELKEIQKVKFTINGKKQKEFKGNFQFDVPFPRTESLISREIAVPSSVYTEDLTGTKDDKDTKKQDTKKQDTKKEDTKKEDVKKTDDKKDSKKSGDADGTSSGTFSDMGGADEVSGDGLE